MPAPMMMYGCKLWVLKEKEKVRLQATEMSVLTAVGVTRPVRYYDNIMYRDNFSNIAIHFLHAIAITATEIMMC